MHDPTQRAAGRPSILILCGSTAIASHTRALLDGLAEALGCMANVRRWDLLREPLPIADPAFHKQPETHPVSEVRSLVAAVADADAIVLGSPLYHGSYSGALKNALDHLRWDAFRGKPVALLSHGANASRCAQPVEHLTSVVRTLYGMNLQTQICTSRSDFKTTAAYPTLASPDIVDRLSRLADELLGTVAMLQSTSLSRAVA